MPTTVIHPEFTDIFNNGPNLKASSKYGRSNKNLSKRLKVVISKIVKRVLFFFTVGKKRGRFKFTAKNIRLTQEAGRLRKTKKKAVITKKASLTQIVRIKKIKVPGIPAPTVPVLIELSQFFEDFTKTLIDDIFYARTIEPAITALKQQIIEKIESIKSSLPTVMEFLNPMSSILEYYNGFLEIFKFLESLSGKIDSGDLDSSFD